MINRIALDLGIYRYEGETLEQYHSRVIYSAMACWVKAIALDRPVGNKETGYSGVSRRHIYERSHTVFKTMLKMFPEVEAWFDLSADNDDPVSLIRTRLINHGDILNIGFETNLALSFVHSIQLSSTIETVYGKTIEAGIQYSGVSSIRYKEATIEQSEKENVKKWFKRFLDNVSWSRDVPDVKRLQYYNPLSTKKNNYEAWQELTGSLIDDVVLVRTEVNKNGYVYYLLKPGERLVHRVDQFFQDQGLHIRIMCALRSRLQNNTTASVTYYSDHIKIRLNAFLPTPEELLFESYAWPVRRINDKLEWVMSIDVWSYIKPYIEALDILISGEEHG